MTTLHERGQKILTVPLDADVRDWLRGESKRRRLPQGTIIARALRAMMSEKLFDGKGRSR